MDWFPQATEMPICCWSQAPSPGTARLLRAGSWASLWSPAPVCSAPLMCKTGQVHRLGGHSCRQAFLQRWTERLWPAQAQGQQAAAGSSCLPATTHKEFWVLWVLPNMGELEPGTKWKTDMLGSLFEPSLWGPVFLFFHPFQWHLPRGPWEN